MFSSITACPPDAIFGVLAGYNADTDARKVNLSIGAYRDNDGKPVVFDSVKEAGRRIYAEGSTFNKEYLPMDGNPTFRKLSQQLSFGKDCKALQEGRVATVQSLSGTGSLAIVGHFLREFFNSKATVYVSNPTWPNHNGLFGELLGFDVQFYPYWNAEKRTCDIEAMCKCLTEAAEGSIVILHACAHNPTGEDPSHDEWQKILDVVKARKHFAVLDSAYQGFATKDLDRDAFAIRLFESCAEVEFAVCQSYAKNMGLYGERAGACHLVCKTAAEAELVQGRMRRFCRLLWSNPPKHGAELATMVLSDEALNANWRAQLAGVSDRIIAMRAALKEGLIARKTPGTWEHITKQIGMFSYTGLTEAQVAQMVGKHHIYLLKSGRISMAGVNESNVNYIADAIDDVVRNY